MSQLKEFFETRNISLEEIAERTGYTPRYVENLLRGWDDINDKVRFRFLMVFPEARDFLLPSANEISVEATEAAVTPAPAPSNGGESEAT